jgi:LysR family glycine cleavage system transcriptional activator
MADELFPVCSSALITGSKPLRCPEDLAQQTLLHTSAGYNDDWRLWLTAAGLPANISKHPGLTFDLILVTVQAAIDGLGVAMGRTSYVEADIAKGRLVVPFKIALPADAGFYLVSPEARADSPKLSAFRHWLVASLQNKA